MFLAYLIVPIDQWLRHRIPGLASAAVIIGRRSSCSGARDARLRERRRTERRHATIIGSSAEDRRRSPGMRRRHLPRGLLEASSASDEAESHIWNSAPRPCACFCQTAGPSGRAFLVGVSCVFFLMGCPIPSQDPTGFEADRAEAVLNIIARMNAATTGFLRAETLSTW